MVRLGLDKWQEECDRITFFGFVLQEMKSVRDSDGSSVFNAALLDTVTKRIIEGFCGLHFNDPLFLERFSSSWFLYNFVD